jgi:hypothetical protein
VDQAKLVKIAGHGGELPANGLQGDEESSVHARGLAWASEFSRQNRNFLLGRE